MNKEQALQKLDALEKEAQALRMIIEAPEKGCSLLERGDNGEDVYVWIIRVSCDENISDEYFKAFKTFILLRHQEGTEVPLDEEMQYLIRLNKDRGLYVDVWQRIGNKVTAISPCFRTVDHAEKAINFIGKENIIHMFKTFHGIYE